jgi:flagellar biogenesis protein FliO
MIAVSTVELTIRMVVALALVSGLLLVVTRTARTRLRMGVGGAPLEVCHRHQVTRSSTVALVRSGRRHLLIGLNDHAITVLAEGDDLVAPVDEGADATAPRARGRRPPSADIDLDLDLDLDLVRADHETGDAAGRPPVDAGTAKGGARKRRRGADRSTPSGMGVIDALRERSVRR